MRLILPNWQLAALVGSALLIVGAALWLWLRPRLSADEIERRRRAMLVIFGRLVDGQLLDYYEIPADGHSRVMLLYSYSIAGVRYESSQDISALVGLFDPQTIRVGMPSTIRYQPGSPENSILLAENWSGLRDHLPVTSAPEVGERRRSRR